MIKTSSIILDSLTLGPKEVKNEKMNEEEKWFWEKVAPHRSQDSLWLPTFRKATNEFYLTPGTEFDLAFNSQNGRLSLNKLNPPPAAPEQALEEIPVGAPPLPTPMPIKPLPRK